MRERSLGITALAFLSIMVGIVAQYGGLSMLLVGTWGAYAGADVGVPMLIVGSLFLGITVAAYLIAFGFWFQKHWSWAGGVVIFISYAAAAVVSAAMSGNAMAAA